MINLSLTRTRMGYQPEFALKLGLPYNQLCIIYLNSSPSITKKRIN